MKPLTFMIDSHQGWIRLFGVGVLWKHATTQVLFSERNGYCRFWHIPYTPWRVRFLRKGSAV